jgi:DNA-binding transcriptional LysR family regulator
MITHRQLLHALGLFKQGNFTRAATQANISQSAFSRSISKLETDLGVLLFDREGNTVIPTRYGETFLRRAAAIVDDTAELKREIDLMRGLHVGNFCVALGMYPAQVSGNPALGQMVRDFPDLQYKALTGNWQTVNQYVLNRTADLGFAAIEAATLEDDLSIEKVSQHQMVIFCRKNHPLAMNGKPSRADLDQFPLVSIRVPAGLAEAIPGQSSIDVDSGHLVPSVEIDDFATARMVVSQSNGIGAAIPSQIESELESGELVLLNFQNPWIAPVHGFIFLKNRTISPAVEVFMETVLTFEQVAEEKNKSLMEKYLR